MRACLVGHVLLQGVGLNRGQQQLPNTRVFPRWDDEWTTLVLTVSWDPLLPGLVWNRSLAYTGVAMAEGAQEDEGEPWTRLGDEDEEDLFALFLGEHQPSQPLAGDCGAVVGELPEVDILAELERHFELDLDLDLDLDALGDETVGTNKHRRLAPKAEEGREGAAEMGQESPVTEGDSGSASASLMVSQNPFHRLHSLPAPSSDFNTPGPGSSADVPAALQLAPSETGLPSPNSPYQLRVLQGKVSRGPVMRPNPLRLGAKPLDAVGTHPLAPTRPATVSDAGRRSHVANIHDIMTRKKVKGTRRTQGGRSSGVPRFPAHLLRHAHIEPGTAPPRN